MVDGILENETDARWLLLAGALADQEVDVFTASLHGVSLWYAYELTRHANSGDMKVGKEGHLLILLDDDVNFGWCHYRKRAPDDEAALEAVRAQFGMIMKIPLNAFMSSQPVGLW